MHSQFASGFGQQRNPAAQAPRTPLANWTVGDVLAFMETMRPKFGQMMDYYRQIIIANDIDGEVLVELTNEQLESLGVSSFGHRILLRKRITELNGIATSGSVASCEGSAGHLSSGDGVPEGNRVFVPSFSNPNDGHDLYSVEESQGMHLPQGPPSVRNDASIFNIPKDQQRQAVSRPATTRMYPPTPRIHESKVTIGHKIGSGSAGDVFAGTYEQHPVAVKKHRMDGQGMGHKALAEFEIEVGRMSTVNHPCIVRCFGMLEPTPGMVLELVAGASLFQILHSKADETFEAYNLRLPWELRLKYLMDAAFGLRAVHNASLIHGDFKTHNLLVDVDNKLKVSDFGLSKALDTLSVLPATKTITGTPQYMAPEVMQSEPQGLRIDIYSYAVVMWEILSGEIPWRGYDFVQIIQKVTDVSNHKQNPPPGRPPVLDIHYQSSPVGYIQLMTDGWSHHPNSRPAIDQMIQTLQMICSDSHQPRQFHQMSQWSGVKRSASEFAIPLTRNERPNHAPHHGGPDPAQAASQAEIKRLVQNLHRPNAVAKSQAAVRLYEACSATNENQESMALEGGLTQAVVLLKNADSITLKIQMAALIAAACGQNKKNRIEAVEAGAVAALVDELSSPHIAMMENSANALANILKGKGEGTGEDAENDTTDISSSGSTAGSTAVSSETSEVGKFAMKSVKIDGAQQIVTSADGRLRVAVTKHDAQNQLLQCGGIQKLILLLTNSIGRIQAAAAAAIANGLADHQECQEAFQHSGGVGPLLHLLKLGDPQAQENGTTVLWNVVGANDIARKEVFENGGMGILKGLCETGTPLCQELAAGAIWKACANDDEAKQDAYVVIPALVHLLRNSRQPTVIQAAGALRSVSVNNDANKHELNRGGGIACLLEVIQSGVRQAKEQASAALANACANNASNQAAARHAGALPILVKAVKNNKQVPSLLECVVAAIRNLCIGSEENQEELGKQGGVMALLDLLHQPLSPLLLRYVLWALTEASTRCAENKAKLRVHGTQLLVNLERSDSVAEAARRLAMELLEWISQEEAGPQALHSNG